LFTTTGRFKARFGDQELIYALTARGDVSVEAIVALQCHIQFLLNDLYSYITNLSDQERAEWGEQARFEGELKAKRLQLQGDSGAVMEFHSSIGDDDKANVSAFFVNDLILNNKHGFAALVKVGINRVDLQTTPQEVRERVRAHIYASFFNSALSRGLDGGIAPPPF